MGRKLTKKRRAWLKRFQGNPLCLAFKETPEQFGGKHGYIALFDPDLDCIVIFPRSLKRYHLSPSELYDEVIKIIAHENLHAAIEAVINDDSLKTHLSEEFIVELLIGGEGEA